MTEEQFNPSLGKQSLELQNSTTSPSMWDILELPADSRRLVNWIIRQKESTLLEVAEYLGTDEATSKTKLDVLVKQGLIQENTTEAKSHYSIKLAAKQKGNLSNKLYQSLTTRQPLVIEINPSSEVALLGSTVELSVTVHNQGNQSARVDIYIDEVSGILREWCAVPHERLALGQGQSSNVVFQIQVPLDTRLGIYDYTIVVDAPEHYPGGTPIRHQATLQLIVAEVDSE